MFCLLKIVKISDNYSLLPKPPRTFSLQISVPSFVDISSESSVGKATPGKHDRLGAPDPNTFQPTPSKVHILTVHVHHPKDHLFPVLTVYSLCSAQLYVPIVTRGRAAASGYSSTLVCLFVTSESTPLDTITSVDSLHTTSYASVRMRKRGIRLCVCVDCYSCSRIN